MKKILLHLFEHKTLSRQQAYEVLLGVGKGLYNEHEVTAFMTVYLMRSITIDELQGFHFSRPLPAAEWQAWALRHGAALPTPSLASA